MNFLRLFHETFRSDLTSTWSRAGRAIDLMGEAGVDEPLERVLFVFVEVEVRDVLVIEPPELLQEPRFPDLPHPLQDQRLATRRVLPLDEIL